MTFIWWLLIISAAVLLLSFFFGRVPAGNVRADEGAQPPGPDRDRGVPVPPDDRPDTVHMRRNHGHEFAEEVSPFAADGAAKVSEEPELFPERTGTTTARALGATEKPQDAAKDKRADGAEGALQSEGTERAEGSLRSEGQTTAEGAASSEAGGMQYPEAPDAGQRGWDDARKHAERLQEQGRLAPARAEGHPPEQGPMVEDGTHGFGAAPQPRTES